MLQQMPWLRKRLADKHSEGRYCTVFRLSSLVLSKKEASGFPETSPHHMTSF